MKKSTISWVISTLLAATTLTGCTETPRGNKDIPESLHLVQPVTATKTSSMNNTAAPQELKIGQGNFFSYAMPPGWRVGEDGQFALTLLAPDNKAMTVMVGNSGLMPGYPTQRFIYETLMSLRPNGLSLGNPVRTEPVKGFQEAFRYQISYNLPGGAYRGEAVCHVNNYYGGCVMAMTAAISENTQWESYAGWLPQVSRQIAASNGAAFGMRGVMQQNLQNSIAFGEAMKAYRDWSNRKWQEVTDDRNNSIDRQNYQFRENLGAINTWSNPYNNNAPLELTTQYQYYWIDQQGRVVGTNDPSINPNQGSTYEWKQLTRKDDPR
jgi:hypothetical protein